MHRVLASAFILLVISAGLFVASDASSDQLCQANRIKVNKKGIAKPALKVAVKCPKGFKPLLDLTVLAAQAKGEKGDPGASAADPLPSGKTVIGVIGGDFQQDDTNLGDWRVMSSLPISAPAVINEGDVVIQNNAIVDNDCLGEPCLATSESSKSAVCTGTLSSPTAPPGKLCIYPLSTINARSLRSFPVPLNSGTPARGVSVSWSVIGSGDTFFNAVWAYTAP